MIPVIFHLITHELFVKHVAGRDVIRCLDVTFSLTTTPDSFIPDIYQSFKNITPYLTTMGFSCWHCETSITRWTVVPFDIVEPLLPWPKGLVLNFVPRLVVPLFAAFGRRGAISSPPLLPRLLSFHFVTLTPGKCGWCNEVRLYTQPDNGAGRTEIYMDSVKCRNAGNRAGMLGFFVGRKQGSRQLFRWVACGGKENATLSGDLFALTSYRGLHPFFTIFSAYSWSTCWHISCFWLWTFNV